MPVYIARVICLDPQTNCERGPFYRKFPAINLSLARHRADLYFVDDFDTGSGEYFLDALKVDVKRAGRGYRWRNVFNEENL